MAMQFLLAAIRRTSGGSGSSNGCSWRFDAVDSSGRPGHGQAVSEAFGNVIAGGRTHRVLVVDNSLSMGYTTAGASRFQDAKKVAAQIVRDSRPGDAVSLIKMAPRRWLSAIPPPT